VQQPLPTGGRTLTETSLPELARCVGAAADKKAEDLIVLDLRNLSDVTDFFVICHGSSDRHVLALADSIEQALRDSHGRRPSHVEGRRSAEWILMDYIDFVVHIFIQEKREFYRIERLWGDAPRLDLPAETEARAGV